MKIVKAYKEDFQRIYPLLLLFENDSLTVEDWEKLFVKYWESDRDYFGYYIEEENEPVGFFGLVFSVRPINNTICTFCNFTSWIVKPEYRKYSLKLLQQVMGEKDVVFTNLTANPALFEMFKRFGFSEVDDHFVFTFPFCLLNLTMNRAKLTNDPSIIKSRIDHAELKLVEDHEKSKAIPCLLYNDHEYCLFFVSKQYKKGLPVSQVLYAGNKQMFAGNIHKITGWICTRHKTIAMMTGNHFLQGREPLLSKRFARKTFFKGGQIDKDDIDFLYSELSK